jgi:tight adherence protein C
MALIILSVLIFMAVTTAALAFYSRSVTDQDPVAIRLRELRMRRSANIADSYARRPPLLLRLIAQLGGFLPATDGADAMRTGLIRAGYRRADAPLMLLGSKVACAILLPLLAAMVSYATGRPLGNLVSISLLMIAVGFYVPTVFIAVKQNQRHAEILASLPDALDLMVVCVEAGLGLGAALQRVGVEIRLASRQLSDELALVNQEMQTGIARSDALRNLAERTGVEDVYSLVAMLSQTDKLGTSVAKSLRAHAESMRTRRRQRAEQMARKASIKLAFPLVFLIFPALLLIILGPAGIQLMKALVNQE